MGKKMINVIEKQSQTRIANNVIVAKGFYDRLMGLMFKTEIKGSDGLLLTPCNSIHTCFMRFSIDVVFLDKKNQVIEVISSMRPWRFTRMYFKGAKVLEFEAGKIGDRLKKGDILELQDV